MSPGHAEHRITRFLAIPDYVTLAGLLAALASIFASLEGHFVAATVFILFSVTCDFFDGRIARRIGREGEFGVQLDGFNDIITCVIGVTVFGYCIGLQSDLAMLCMALFCVGGVLRLSRYAITGTVDGYYEGVPVTFGLAILGAFWLCQWLDLPISWLPLLYALGAFLMVSTIRVKKP